MPKQVLTLISLMAGPSFRAKATSLTPPSVRLTTEASAASQWRPMPQSGVQGRHEVAALLFQGGQKSGRLVIVVELQVERNFSRIASSMESDRRFSAGKWWALRVFIELGAAALPASMLKFLGAI